LKIKDLVKNAQNNFAETVVHGMLEFEWTEWLAKKKLVF